MSYKNKREQEKEDWVYQKFTEAGIRLSKREVEELAKIRKDALLATLRKLASRPHAAATSIIELPMDRRVANVLWAIWKAAQSRYGRLNHSEKYTIEISGNHLFALRECAEKIYKSLRQREEK